MTFGSVIRILVVVCLVGPDLTKQNEVTCGGFSVRKVSGTAPFPKQIVKFKDEITNLGGWDQDTGIFKASCSGAYSFSFNIITPQNEDFRLALMKNEDIELEVHGSSISVQEKTNSALLLLNHGDEVNLQLLEGTIPVNPNDVFTSFTGFRITL